MEFMEKSASNRNSNNQCTVCKKNTVIYFVNCVNLYGTCKLCKVKLDDRFALRCIPCSTKTQKCIYCENNLGTYYITNFALYPSNYV